MDALPLADLLQALADPTRLRILALLRRMELSVGELAFLLDQSQPRVSRHVRILADAGVVERRTRGKLGIPDDRERRAHPSDVRAGRRLGGRGSDKLFQSDASKLDRIRADRAEAATRYFTSHADVWDSIRSLHVAESEVEEAIAARSAISRWDALSTSAPAPGG